MSKKYYWLKLKEDFFRLKEIKKLRQIAGGDTYTIIYQKMLLLSIKNEGFLFYDGIDDDFASELALDIDEELDNVRITLSYLQKNNLIGEIQDNEFQLTKCNMMIGKECTSAERVRKHRVKEKMLQGNDNLLQSNTDVTKCNTEIEIDIEKEIKIEKEIDIEKEIVINNDDVANSNTSLTAKKIVDSYNTICTSLPHVQIINANRKKAIKARIKDNNTLAEFEHIFTLAQDSDFLSGRGDKWIRCGFDWILKSANWVKIAEGNYKNKKSGMEKSAESFADWSKNR